MRKIIFILLISHISICASFACCSGEPHTLTELLLHDQYNRTIFLCRVYNTAANLQGGFFSKAKVNEVFKGRLDSSFVVIHTGGNSSAGGRPLKPYSDWLIFSQMNSNGTFNATVCDWFSCSGTDDPEKFYNTLQIISSYKKMTESAYTGTVVWYFPDGAKAAEGNFLEGKPEGKWVHFRHDGTLKSETRYKNGLRHGEATEILENNRGIAVSTYYNGVLMAQKTSCEECPNYSKSEMRISETKEGLQKRHYKSWHPNGMISSDFFQESTTSFYYLGRNYSGFESWFLQKDSLGKVLNNGQYSRGAKIGKWIETNEKTKETTEVQYPEPVLPAFDFFRFYENGGLELAGNLKNGKPEGTWKFYSQKGSLVREANFEDGELSGEERHFHYQSEKVSEQCQYKNGKKHGEQLGFFNDGSIQSQCFYENGVKHGAEITYLKPEVWQSKANYLNGMLHGDYISRDPQGDTLLVATFQNDALYGKAIEYSKELKTCQKSTGRYENGFKKGEWSVFDCQGKLKKKCVFEGEDCYYCYYGSLDYGKCRSVE
ncbi:MAG: hypothetical protein IPH31_19935 [Lewinellaceae bacterium]|nr:hypothetical protein [Lewinellaceae bacterium]